MPRWAPSRGHPLVYTTTGPAGGDVRYLNRLGHLAGLSWTDTMPGGNEQLTCTLNIPTTWRDKALDPGRFVHVVKGANLQWEGILDEPTAGDGGWQITARGAGTWGHLYQAEWTSWTASNILSRAVARGLGWVVGSVGGGYLTEQHDSAAMTVGEFLDLYTDPGSLVWRVQRVFAGQQVDVFPVPTVPTRLLITTVPANRTLAGYINVLWIRYQLTADAGNTPATFGLTSVSNAASIARHGRQEAYWDISQGGVMSAGAAQALGNAALAKYTAASWSGPFQVAPGQYLTMGGAEVDHATEHAGEVVQLIMADGPFGGEVAPSWPVTFPVGKVEYRDADGTLLVTPFQAWTSDLGGVTAAAGAPLEAAAKAKARAAARARAAAAHARAVAAHARSVAAHKRALAAHARAVARKKHRK